MAIRVTYSGEPPVVSGMEFVKNVKLLWLLRNADLAITTDQALVKMFEGTLWVPQAVRFVCKSGAYNTACLGGIYTAISKGGTAFVAASQSFASLTGVGKSVAAAVAAGSDAALGNALYLSLSTANTGALVSDIFIFGYVVD